WNPRSFRNSGATRSPHRIPTFQGQSPLASMRLSRDESLRDIRVQPRIDERDPPILDARRLRLDVRFVLRVNEVVRHALVVFAGSIPESDLRDSLPQCHEIAEQDNLQACPQRFRTMQLKNSIRADYGIPGFAA